MAIKILRGGLINQEKAKEPDIESPGIQPVNKEEVIPQQGQPVQEMLQQEQPVQEFPEQKPTGMTRAEANKLMEEKPEGKNLSNIFSRLGISLVEGLDAPAKLLDKVSEAVGIGQLTAGGDYNAERTRKDLGYSKEEVQPKSTAESYLQKVLKQSPSVALFGGPQALATNALSAAPATAIGAFGGPEWLQDLVQLGADIGIGIKGIDKLGIKPTISTKPLKDAQQKMYETARYATINRQDASADTIIGSLTDVAKNLTTETDGKIVKRVDHVMDIIQNNVKTLIDEFSGKATELVDPKKAMDIRRKINKMYDKNKDIIEYTKPIVDAINTTFNEYSVKNPEFFDALSKGDQLTSAIKIKSSIVDKISEYIPNVGGIGKFISEKIFSPTLGSTEKIVKKIIESPEARKAYLNLGESIVTNNPETLIRNIQSLKETINVKEQPYFRPRKAKAKKTYKIISGEKIR